MLELFLQMPLECKVIGLSGVIFYLYLTIATKENN